MTMGTGDDDDDEFAFVTGLSVRLCDVTLAFDCNVCGVIETPPPMNRVDAFGIGLNVILLLTPVTGTTFWVAVVTVRGVTVSSLFLVIAVTASLVASLAFDVLD